MKINIMLVLMIFAFSAKSYASSCEVMEYAELKEMTLPELKKELAKAQDGIDEYERYPRLKSDETLRDATQCRHQWEKIKRAIAKKESAIDPAKEQIETKAK